MLFKRIFNKSRGDLGWIYLVHYWGQVAGLLDMAMKFQAP
jgi:hypothetical protein